MTVSLSCFAGVGWQFLDNNANPLTGGLLRTYAAGTTTPATTYTTSAGNVAHTNPIVLDAAGRVPSGEIWLTSAAIYKFSVETSTGVLIATYDNVPGIATAADIAAFAADLANASDPAKGDALVGFRQSDANGNLANSVGRTVHAKLQEYVSVKDFGAVGDGVTNDTTAFQNALNQSNKKTVIIPAGRYLINSLEVTQQFTTILSEGAELVLNPVGAYTHALKLSTNFLTIVGQLTFDGGLNSNYDCTLWIKGGYGRYENITFRFCKLAIRIGESGVNQVSLSEMFFSKCITNGCRNALEMYGLFSVANFTDCLMAGNEDASWAGQDGTTIKNFGGRIFYENGYLYGGSSDTQPIIEINQTDYLGTFYTGSVYLNNIDSESYGKPFLRVTNTSVTSIAPTSGDVFICNSRIDFFNYAGLSPQPVPFYFNNFYTGSFKTINNRFKFFDPMTRRPIEIGANTRAQINVEDIVANFPYYGTNAIVYPGLPPQIPFQTVLNLTMNNAFTAGSGGGAQPVIFDTKRVGIQGNRITLSDNYDTSTGVFTVPQGGLSSIMVIANYRVSGALGANAVAWIQHVSSSGGFTRQMGYSPIVAAGGQVIANIAEAAEGDEITFEMDTQNAGAALNVGLNYNNQMSICAYITTPNA
jgi:hypothetical protein